MKYDLFATLSLNGYIDIDKRNDDYFTDSNWDEYIKVVKKYGNIIIGRKTYEMMTSWVDTPEFLASLDDVKIFVLTDDKDNIKIHRSNVSLCGDINEIEQKLIENNFECGLVAGGNKVYSYFYDNDLINNMILNYNPVVIASNGVPLFTSIINRNTYSIKSSQLIAGNITQILITRN